jgi:hypothetical protein
VAVEARRDWEVTRATGSDILDDDEDPPPKLPIEELKQKYERRYGPPRKFPDDRFVSEDGQVVVMIIRASSHSTNYQSDAALLSRVKADVKDLGFSQKYAGTMRVGYAGDVPTRVEEMEGLATDLGLSGVLVTALAAVLLPFRSVARALDLGLQRRWAVSRIRDRRVAPLDHQPQPNTAFLGSIVVGSGINSGIMCWPASARNEWQDGAWRKPSRSRSLELATHTRRRERQLRRTSLTLTDSAASRSSAGSAGWAC